MSAQVTCFYSVATNTCTTLQNECTPPLECPDFGDCCTKAWFEGGQTQAACPGTLACAVIPTPTESLTPTPTGPTPTATTPTPTNTPAPTGDPNNPVECNSGYTCDFVAGGMASNTCENNAGYDEYCKMPGGSDVGNCCIPLTGVYLCSGNGHSTCTTELNVGYTCDAFGNNFGPCQPGDDSCKSCDELADEACYPVSAPLPCVEQNETIGYKCDAASTGCYPCIEGDTSFGCDPPEYLNSDFGSAAGAYNECAIVCSGQSEKHFTCDVELGCIESGSGPYVGYGECAASCGSQALFCNANGAPTIFDHDADGNPNRLNTAFGCIAVAEISEFSIDLLTLGMSIGGGISLLLIAVSGILMKLSAGNPQRVQAAKELFMAALSGLLLIVFSVFILRLFGVEALAIPGL